MEINFPLCAVCCQLRLSNHASGPDIVCKGISVTVRGAEALRTARSLGHRRAGYRAAARAMPPQHPPPHPQL